MNENTQEKSLTYCCYALVRDNLFTICVILVLVYGWNNRDDNYLSAESGTGYVFGIVGGSLMLTLLLYPMSKRSSALTRMVPPRYWFGIHMLLGVIGPVLILFHSNFHMGSLNSSVALFSMLTVAASGVIGRYIYTRIHRGLYGSRLSLSDLKNENHGNHVAILRVYTLDDSLASKFESIEAVALKPYTGIATSFWNLLKLASTSRWLQWRSIRLIKTTECQDLENTGVEREQMVHSIRRYMKTLRKTAGFQLYERMFSLWHLLHLPLFFMMIITAIVHIIAVHTY
jgi:hypothetical protein